MRLTNQYLFDNFNTDHSKALKELNKVTQQVSSGQKIEESYEDSAIYSDILRFDSHINDLDGIKSRAQSARSFADATDSVLTDFNNTLRDFHTKLLVASNGTMNSDNLDAVANELSNMKEHMISLSNTKINGQYIFSGTATNVKPIDDNGKYQGNDADIKVSVGDGVDITSNINGKDLFLGDDLNIHKSIETNVKLTNHANDDTKGEPLTINSNIQSMIADDSDPNYKKDVTFFIEGTKNNGTSFKNAFTLKAEDKIETMLSDIKKSFDNEVNVELTKNGTINITDKKSGYSQVEFKMYAKQDTKVIEFSKLTSTQTTDDSINADKQNFNKDGSKLTGNVALIDNGKFATDISKLSDMMNSNPLADTTFKMKLTDINGSSQEVTLNLSDNSSFTIGGQSYDIFNADETNSPTTATQMTMGQVNNIISMAVSGKLPTSNSAEGFNEGVKNSRKLVDVNINQNGNLEINDLSKDGKDSKIEFSMYDDKSGDFSNVPTDNTSVEVSTLSFMSNNAITTQQSHINFFDELDSVIDAVKNGVNTLGSNSQDVRSFSIQTSLSKLDQFSSHFSSAQSKMGATSNSFQVAEDKASALKVNVTALKAETTEVDMAETAVKLQQLTLGYQAMLQTISKVNSLSLLNYMR